MNNLHFDLARDKAAIIKVIGVGGGGNNAVNHMHQEGIIGVNFVICNTDAQALDNSNVSTKIQLGPLLTQGLGAGSNPQCGEEATVESMEEIREILGKNTKMVFVTAGMGGGTGTGGAPIVAKIAREMGILTVGIVTTPFSFEGKRKYNQALEGIEKLKQNVDTILVISNDKIREMYGNARSTDAFNHANNILTMAAKSISEIITVTGYINVDFADVKYVMLNGGAAIMGAGVAEGENRAMRAVQAALNSPLLNDNDIRGAKKILLNITSSLAEQVTIDEITEINEYVQEVAKDTDIIFGTCDNDSMGAKLSVTLIATGFEATSKPAFFTPTNKRVIDLNQVSSEPEKASIAKLESTDAILSNPNVKTFLLEDDTILAGTNKVETAGHLPSADEKPLISMVEDDSNLFTTLSHGEPVPSEAVTFEFELETASEVNLEEELKIEAETLASASQTDEITEVVPAEESGFTVHVHKSYQTNESSTRQVLERDVNDVKRRLANLSYKNKPHTMADLEATPAYLRKGVEVKNNLPSTHSEMSKFTLSIDEVTMRPEVKKNNGFLHDNVD